ncbi:hypothetical protein [Sabulibacter ruber]|uniref:hypothetical protein n=1 Tax=Sabulibacter ruber TaxID=2811901 RepID=UPI001A970370|nr:hypothetical protein [Sabulibacter ruber]
MHTKGGRRNLVANRTYLWHSSITNAVNMFVEMAYLKPVMAPRYFLHFTEKGLAVVAELECNFAKNARLLLNGPAPLNMPAKRSQS